MTNASEQSDKPVSWRAAGPPALAQPVEAWEEIPELSAPASRALSAKVVWRAARRHWWRILLLWGLVSTGLVALAYNKIKTSYDATVWLIVRTTTTRLFDQATSQNDLGRFQKTQVELATSPDVLSDTLASHPELARLPMLQGIDDPEGEIRRAVHVAIRPDTSLITVSTSSEDSQEAKQVVDAVVESYLKAANTWASEESQEQINRLNDEKRKLDKEIRAKRTKLQNLVKETGTADLEAVRDQGKLSLERFQSYLGQYDNVRLNRIDLESKLEVARLRQGKVVAKLPQQQMNRDQLVQQFYADPQVAALQAQKADAEEKLERVKRLARKESDPSRAMAEKRIKDLEKKITKLWQEKAPALQRTMVQETQAEEDKAIQELQAEVDAAKSTEDQLSKMLTTIEVQTKDAGGNALQLEFAKAELDKDERLLITIQNQINQIEFDSKGPERVARANTRTSVTPSSNKRLKVMAATPVGVLVVVLALFVLVEVRSGRVADPDDLSARVRVEVIGVVPPLPSLRTSRALWGSRDEIRARRQLEEFVQSLDHLRVALCASRRGGEANRCVLITSACSSEGKTTLAAHLAGRCANAGLSTLLIDADLRNPSLSRLLKVPDGPGLSDILRGEVSAEAAMMVIEAGGGFHLLPAGTPGYDPSRLLQGDQLKQLLTQVRQAFDIIIMDAPPVLLVPDALTVGRCTDGAVLAVRYDTSRFTLVERAHRRLAAVGVPVIGAVVNGVRTMESSYGYYSYAYHGDRTSSSSAIDVPVEPTA